MYHLKESDVYAFFLMIILFVLAVLVVVIIRYKKERIIIKNQNGEIVRDNILHADVSALIGLPYGNYFFEIYHKPLWRKERLVKTLPVSYNKTSESNYHTYLEHINDTRGNYFNSSVGAYGEWLIEDVIIQCCQHRYYKILHNIYIPKDDKGNTTEIDTILIDVTGIFVIESKNYSGWIFGNEHADKWVQSIYNKASHYNEKYYFYNPIKQNQSHINALSSLLKLPISNFISYIVFSERCDLKSVPMNLQRFKIFKRDALSTVLYHQLTHSPVIFTEEQIDQIFSKLFTYANVPEHLKQEHVQNIKNKIQ
ncbi:MAG: nuclease-related domain-containing protein [Clostridiales bacterium]|nr:nuclease-related domain-containing protein [Clostridiales bacterium]